MTQAAQSKVHTFRANSLDDALDLVHRELGLGAIILHTRQVERRRLLPFTRKRVQVEIEAQLPEPKPKGNGYRDDDLAPPPQLIAPAEPLRVKREVALPITGVSAAPLVNIATRTKGVTPVPAVEVPNAGEVHVEQAGRGLGKQAAGNRPMLRSELPVSGAESREIIRNDVSKRPIAPASPSGPFNRANDVAINGPETSRVLPPTGGLTVNGTSRPKETKPARSEVSSSAMITSLETRLDRIERILAQLKQDDSQIIVDRFPRDRENVLAVPGSTQEYLQGLLTSAGIEAASMTTLLEKFHETARPEMLNDRAACKGLLTAIIEQRVRTADPIRPIRGRRKVVALVGPTGVGKTTTLAKLAANFRLRDGVKMGLVTIDTYRIAAVEQLRTYADIIELPMKVVTNGHEMQRALAELQGLDLVLIDTAGRSPNDELKIQELKSVLTDGLVDETHLVLSLTASAESLIAAAEKFKSVNPTSVILTKLDEAVGGNVLLAAAAGIPYPISYLTTGQGVPDDIEPAHRTRIAEWILSGGAAMGRGHHA
jgi:flagellar biosynthetic protein FlhF